MKKFLHLLAGMVSLCLTTASNAQYFENFSSYQNGSVPPGWSVASNTDISVYQRPGTCSVNNKGLQTPGVGQSAPTGFVLPATTYNAAFNDIVIRFSIFVFDANLRCGAARPFPCPTFVKAYIVPLTWNDPLAVPTATQYYAEQANYQILYPNASNTIVFTNISIPAGVTGYRVLLNFKQADGSNCTSGGTKFVFDDFSVASNNCNNCLPVANDDYFNADVQSLFLRGTQSFKANVYGGYAFWANEANNTTPGFEISSLTNLPAVNNGTDYDLNNSSLSAAVFTLASPLVVESNVAGCGSLNPGTLQFNPNGTFTYTKGSACVSRVSFTYTLTINPYGTTAPAKVTIDLPGQLVTLPVTLVSFSANYKAGNVVLNWQTATELNNKGFFVQRNTGNGWKDLALVFSAATDGNSSTGYSYAFTDKSPAAGINQYRLLQVDFDGRGQYSETRAIHGADAGTRLLLFPNPSTNGAATLVFGSTGSKEVMVRNLAGSLVQQYKNIKTGNLEIKNLLDGFYTVQVTDATTGETAVEKLIIKKR
jgi:hypothetical protein